MRKRRRAFGAPPRPVVRTTWFALWPGRPRDFWGRVGLIVRDRRIRHGDLEKVRAVCAEVEGERKWTS